MLARLGRVVLFAAVLLAQHTALAHQLSHAIGVPSEASTLCDVHDLLGTVLGAAAGDARTHEPVAHKSVGFVEVVEAVADAALPALHSRGPPPVS